jgi:hypothetical protein
MGVRVDAHHAAEIERGLVPAPIEIKPPWVSVDLDGDLVPGAGAQHLLDVDFVAGAPLELAAGHVTDDGGMRVGDGP